MDKLDIPVYLESGRKRTLAIVPQWPGWCRVSADETSALQTLLDYAPRYAKALAIEGLSFQIPGSLTDFHIQEHFTGKSSPDFGVPESELPTDLLPVTPGEIKYFKTLLTACWKTFDNAVEMAQNHELTKGPRGGGRDLDKIVEHVHNVDGGYLKKLGGPSISGEELWESRYHILDALSAANRGEFPAEGPRGGKRWSPRYFVRRLAWHELDHAWEIEDRIIR
jgi:hypothetical protein